MDIRLSGVTKIFHPDITALEDVYLEIPKGEFVYLVGPTGSGKTTLMRTITREVVPSRGQITVGAFSLRKISRVDLSLFRRDVGVVFQDFCLLPHLTVFENVAFVLEVLGMPAREVKERTGEVLDRVNLWRRRFLYPPQLSGGEQSLSAIALLFASMEVAGCPLAVLDEVDAALDEVNLRRFADLAREYAQSRQILAMTHRRVTMERADLLYGVTLSEPGLSQVVGVRLEDWS